MTNIDQWMQWYQPLEKKDHIKFISHAECSEEHPTSGLDNVAAASAVPVPLLALKNSCDKVGGSDCAGSGLAVEGAAVKSKLPNFGAADDCDAPPVSASKKLRSDVWLTGLLFRSRGGVFFFDALGKRSPGGNLGTKSAKRKRISFHISFYQISLKKTWCMGSQTATQLSPSPGCFLPVSLAVAVKKSLEEVSFFVAASMKSIGFVSACGQDCDATRLCQLIFQQVLVVSLIIL